MRLVLLLGNSVNTICSKLLGKLKKTYNLYIINCMTMRLIFFKRKKDKMMLSFLETEQIEAALQGNL